MMERQKSQYTSFEKRLFALLIDLIILAVLITITKNIMIAALPDNIKEDIYAIHTVVSDPDASYEDKNAANIYFFESGLYKTIVLKPIFVIILLVFTYFYLLWLCYGATFGKKILQCKIIDAKTGADPSALKLLLRLVTATLNICFFGIGYVFMFFTQKKQALHDIICGTIVINK